MNPGPATPADQPFVLDGRIWRRIVIAFYLASSSAAVLFGRGMGHDLAWIPGVGWAANIAIVLAAIALARTHAPLRLQLALASAAPVLFVVLRSGMAVYSGALAEENILMLGLAFGWAIYSDLFGSVVAFGIALAALALRRASPVGPGVLLRAFRALGWIIAATWLYILGFALAANHWPEYKPYMDGLLLWIFKAATVIGWGLAPLWLVGAIALVLSSILRKQRPALADTVALVLVVCLMGVYLTLAFSSGLVVESSDSVQRGGYTHGRDRNRHCVRGGGMDPGRTGKAWAGVDSAGDFPSRPSS
jgi:hypothetical protein